MSEYTEHLQICNYLATHYSNVLFTTDLSGVKLNMGTAIKVKNLKSCRGFPDIFILQPNKNFKGLFIELKKSGQKIFKKDGSFKSEHLQEQSEVIKRLNDLGYLATFCIGSDNAIEVIDSYLSLL